jgi:hypothetical protein
MPHCTQVRISITSGGRVHLKDRAWTPTGLESGIVSRVCALIGVLPGEKGLSVASIERARIGFDRPAIRGMWGREMKKIRMDRTPRVRDWINSIQALPERSAVGMSP